ncbi:MAG: hypothetical protein ABIG44_12730 [Planctomycetota bacterium]
MKGPVSITLATALALGCGANIARADALGTGFMYQGQLRESGFPANGDYDFVFRLFDAATDGVQVDSDFPVENWPVSDGLFTVQVDFGDSAFNSDARWLEVAVRPWDSNDPHTVLSPRQPITAAPVALYALDGPGATGFWEADGDTIVNTNSGFVGVGRSTPIVPSTEFFGVLTPTGDNAYGGMHIQTEGASGWPYYGYSTSSGVKAWTYFDTGANKWHLYTGGTRLTVDGSTGNVGIGTTSPASLLEVESITGAHGISSTTSAIPVAAYRTSTSGTWPAIHAECDSESADASAIRAYIMSTSPGSSSVAVKGVNHGTGGAGIGVIGTQDGSGYGVYGYTPSGRGVYGLSTNGVGVYGSASGTSGEYYGVYGTAPYAGVCGVAAGGRSFSYGVRALAEQADTNTNYGIYALAENAADYNFAGRFIGMVSVLGHLSKSSGSFEIDHPLDPANKYLRHSFVESPDMMNVYNGNVVTDARGYAEVTLPEWFETLNRDFRYQLTVIDETDNDTFVQAKVVSGIRDNRFRVRTSAPGAMVSWQVTGIRQDPWANAHRIQVEEEKCEKERGSYLHPELYGQPKDRRVDLWLEAAAQPTERGAE